MADGGDWGGDAVTSTSRKQKGGKLGKVGKLLKSIWPGTSSKEDGQNTGTTTEKQSGIESGTSMECEAADEEREQYQYRRRGIGDVVHGPGTDPSGEIHHDRDSSNKESSNLIQVAELQSLGTSVDIMAEGGDREGGSVACTSKEQKDVQRQHKETLRAQTETLSVNTILMKEKVKNFLLRDRYAKLTIISTVRHRRLVEHELLKSFFKEMKRFWSDHKAGSSAAVAGVPGIGKTTMVQKLVHDWATGKIYRHFQFVFSFKFRDLNVINCSINLRQLILHQYPYFGNMLGEVWKKPEGLLFIFDGMDEFKGRIDFSDCGRDTEPQHQCPDPESRCNVSDIVYSLIQHKLLPGCSVLVTTRPTALHLLEKAEISVRAEILGFVGEERKEYFTKYFEDQSVAAAVFKHVKENEILYTMSYNPSYCWQPSQFLSGFMMELLEREDSARSVVYTFPHLTIQEFVAALAQFLTVDPGNIVKFLSEAHSTTDGRFEVFLRFVAGLSSPRSARGLEEFLGQFPNETTCRVIDWVKEEVQRRARNTESEDGPRSLLNTMHYLFESQNPALAQQTLESVETLSFSGLGLTPIDCAVLSHVIRLCDKIKHLDLEDCRIQCEGFQRLGPVLHKCQHLRLVFNDLGYSGVKLVSAALRNPDCKIQKLELYGVGLTDSGAMDLVSSLSTTHTVTELDLGGNKLGDSGVKLVSAALRNPDCKIQTLGLYDVRLTDSGAKDLISTLSTNTSLTGLDLGQNSLTDRCVPALRRLILAFPRLKLIRLCANKFSADGRNQLKSLQGTRRGLSVDVWTSRDVATLGPEYSWSANGVYDRATLLRLRECSPFGHLDPSTSNPYPELIRYSDSSLSRHPDNDRPRRRRGRRGGTERRLRRLRNLQDCSMLCFCETWLGERTPDEAITPDGYTAFREDRSAADSGKTRGGGTAVLVKQTWCTDCKLISKSCSENVEDLTVKLRPFYLPRELQCIIVSVVYIPPSAKEEAALRELHNMINEHENKYPDAAFIILGDFNHCNLKKNIPKLYQFVTFPTRGNKTLDHCYSNIKNAFTAEPIPHFGKSDHLAIRLKPTYTKRLKA
ncbi:NACHT, LRR and PYD domains-containing protein 12-like [Amblyraja radiata]|uniref:NACHT, LRR and PYD domains-containing protein 12-like n=1 Tax=Amblyraja radiata TaxID=386614 RepID=UPI0014033BBF|nr:NACHT, LRR and PYD domains-containing protein 12-like [Amblyraja radiata]